MVLMFLLVGDVMVRELDFSRITLRIVERSDDKGEGDKDHVVAKLTGNTADVLRQALYQPYQLVLRDNNMRESKVTVSLKYLPVKMQLDPSESFNNQGTLKVEIHDAADLPAADRNGYSDPFCKFYLDGKDVFKTKTIKKTLHPVWNEQFDVQIRSRTAVQFELKVYDWDFGDSADFLGGAKINLELLEPFHKQEVNLALDGKSGTIRLRMLFTPDYITRSRQGSSTFQGTFAAPGKVIGAPVKTVGKGAVFVGGGVVKGASFIGRGFRRRKSRGAVDDEESTPNGTPPTETNGSAAPAITIDGSPISSPGKSVPSAPSPSHSRTKSAGSQSAFGASLGGADTGTASISIVSASGYPAKANVQIHVTQETGAHKVPKEIIKTAHIKSGQSQVVQFPQVTKQVPNVTADAQYKLVVKDHSTFGSDEELGEAVFFVEDQGSGGGERTLTAGEGTVVIRTGFALDDTQSITPSQAGSTFKRSMFGTKRESREDRRPRSVSTALKGSPALEN